MVVALGLQIIVVAALALFTGAVWGWGYAASLAFGGGAVIVPNALFAARLAFQRGRPPESYLVVFFAGEFVKIGLTVALLVWAAKFMPQLRWAPLVAGLIAAVQAPLFVPLIGRRRGPRQSKDRERQEVDRQENEPDANRPQPPTRENR
jgi:ATP synthase protein I